MHQGGFVPAEMKNQQRVNHPSPTSNPSMYRLDPTTSPQVQLRGEGFRGTEQVQTLFHQTTPSRLEEPKQLTSIQCQTESSLEFVSVCRVPEAPFGGNSGSDFGLATGKSTSGYGSYDQPNTKRGVP